MNKIPVILLTIGFLFTTFLAVSANVAFSVLNRRVTALENILVSDRQAYDELARSVVIMQLKSK